MYDLRDPSYVPPHLRQPQGTAGQDSVPAALETVTQPPYVPAWVRARGDRGPAEKYPFRATDAGCSFKIPPGDDQPKFGSIRAMCSYKGKNLGRVYRCHQYPDGTIEVWRER